MKLDRKDYISSLEQLITVSCILAGFSISGLISLPGIESTLYGKIVTYFRGNFDLTFFVAFYSLLFSTMCFLGTIITILVYKINNYYVPMKKLRFIHLTANIVFSLAIATLMTAVISFGIPNTMGVVSAIFVGMGMAACFIWENMLPWQRRVRQKQMERENQVQEKEQNGELSEKEQKQESQQEQA